MNDVIRVLAGVEQDARASLCRAGKLLERKELVSSNLGTISLAFEKDRFLVKPNPVDYFDAAPEDFVMVDENGNPIVHDQPRPSLNWLVHAACYRRRPDAGAVVHAHPRNVVALISTLDRTPCLRLLTGETVWHVKPVRERFEDSEVVGIPIVDNLNPAPLAEAVGKEIVRADVVAIRNHGIMAVGRDIKAATRAALVVEEQAAIICAILQNGGQPAYLPADKIWDELASMPPSFGQPFGDWCREQANRLALAEV